LYVGFAVCFFWCFAFFSYIVSRGDPREREGQKKKKTSYFLPLCSLSSQIGKNIAFQACLHIYSIKDRGVNGEIDVFYFII
jgi:hypothetical protein